MVAYSQLVKRLELIFHVNSKKEDAVIKLNKEDNINRKFILIENDEKICNLVTRQRIKRVINYYNAKQKYEEKVMNVENGFKYCKFDMPLFDEYGNIKD